MSAQVNACIKIGFASILTIFLLWIITPLAMGAPPQQRPPTEPGSRPPVSSPPSEDQSGGGSDDNSSSNLHSAIWGTVTDLSTDQPGAGLVVMINGIPITTDWDGHYSLTGQPHGEYYILLSLPNNWQPAQDPMTIILNGQNQITVDLAYYSELPPIVPALEILPDTGASVADNNAMLKVGWGMIIIALQILSAITMLLKAER